jgi:hypothetical protein
VKNDAVARTIDVRSTYSFLLNLLGGESMDVTDVSNQLLTECDVAAHLRCSLEVVRRYRAERALPAFYVGTQLVFRRFDVEALCAEASAASRTVMNRVAFGTGVRRQRVVQPLLCDTTELMLS